ncbi:DoxX family protein [Aliiroseovarius sp. S253]|uniref:DoxX family protein n=1 Tax=Aliiroseovarius sp. S253 TaxID=3415133 RepID=UPI003C7E4AB5
MTAVTLFVGLLSAFFLFASSIKIFGWQKKIFEIQLGMFQSYGLNRQIMALVGCVELFGAIAIWFQSSLLGPLGALALLGTSLGAIACHLIFDSWKDGVPAMITATLSAFILWSGLDKLLGLIG